MGAETELENLLTSKFPALPKEVKEYILSVVLENHDEFERSDDVFEAVGELIISSCEKVREDSVRTLCDQITKIMAIGTKTKTVNGSLHRVLDAPVHMHTMDSRIDNPQDFSSVFLVRKPENKLIDIAKREALAAEKSQARNKAGPRYQECSASASQAANRNESAHVGKLTGVNLDIKIENIDLAFGDSAMLRSADLNLPYGRRIGLVGRNGIGKTTLFKMLSSGTLRVPSCIRMLHVEQEVIGDDTLAIDAVLASDTRREELIAEEKRLQLVASSDSEDSHDVLARIAEVYRQLEECDADKALPFASAILHGLGFSTADQRRPTKEFSGGWRMRLSLAQGLFMKPDLLLLDEPTNMLDMKAVIWLENYLNTWKSTLFLVSHDRMFLNEVCTDVIHMHSGALDSYRGNYDAFEKTMVEKLTQQQREFEAQQELRKHTQQFIDKFRYNAKRASLVQSKIKFLERLPILKPVEREAEVVLKFPDCESLKPPVLQLEDVSFSYTPESPPLFKNIQCNVDSESRICINGAGKTTLLKLILGDLSPSKGFRNAHRHLKMGYFTQHHVDQLEMDYSALELIAQKFPGRTSEQYRADMGRFGLSGDIVLRNVTTLSGGQKSRLAFALLALQQPNFLVMDEPTNHLDVESVEALGKALLKYPGAVVLVSHDERLIDIVCKELWMVKDKKVSVLEGGLKEYKRLVIEELGNDY